MQLPFKCWLVTVAVAGVISGGVQAQTLSGALQHVNSGLCVTPLGDLVNANTNTKIALQDKCDSASAARFFWLSDGSLMHAQSGLCVVPQSTEDELKEGIVLGLAARCDGNLSRFEQNASGAIVHSRSKLCIQAKTSRSAPKSGTQLVLKSNCASTWTAFEPFASTGTDADRDGIPDRFDLCPATPEFTPVDGKGCPLDFRDDDFDGVINSFDECPATPPGTQIDFSNGCPLDLNDDDKDGVINSFDVCPRTPLRKRVDFQGCPLDFKDADKDGVANAFDLCANTPRGDRVDDFGCTLPPDADGDGVIDAIDRCPGTPTGTVVDSSTGCPLDLNDDDTDGVINSSDLCPNTPPGTPVDPQGCPVPDEDGDGVPDTADGCPGTPAGIAVDFNGCPLDGDADGVPDTLDQCPNTPFGTTVDPVGCPLSDADEDADAVPDRLDLCPGTPAGELVNPQGCPAEFAVAITGQSAIRGITNAQLEIAAADLVTSGPVDDLQLRVLPLASLTIFAEEGDRAVVLSSNTRLSGSLQVPVFFAAADGSTSNVFQVSIEVRPLDVKSSLIVHDDATLDATGIDLASVFDRLTAGESGQSGAQLFRQFWDNQLSVSTLGSSIICNGRFNGFPIVCDRFEAIFATGLSDQELLADMQSFRLLAAVNRMELHNRWQDCGEHRLVFGKIINGRNFLILEARLPNPTPGQPSGCANIVDFWDGMSNLDPQTQAAERAARLRGFFLEGTVTGTPVIAAEHFMAAAGQIRTNQFMQRPWLLRENKLARTCDPVCRITAHPVSVKENPFGELFNPALPSGSPLAGLAAEFQDAFVQNLASLTTGNLVELKNEFPDRFNNGQSHSDVPNLVENEYGRHFGGNLTSEFGVRLTQQLQGVTDARGAPLTVAQVINRSTALNCGGCHQPGFFGLTEPGSIGALRLPNGAIIDSWPDTLGFVHVDEQRNLSPALERVFLPVRLQAFAEIIAEVGGL